MSKPSTHTINVKDFPRRVGEGDGADTVHEEVDITFTFIPCTTEPPHDAEPIAEAAVPLGKWDIAPDDLLELAQEWLDGDGYEMACGFAEARRPVDPEELRIEE